MRIGPALGHSDAREPCFKSEMNDLGREQQCAYMVETRTPKDSQILRGLFQVCELKNCIPQYSPSTPEVISMAISKSMVQSIVQ
ncbi:hypothetical protein L208DRAFT_490659 [Tricholoma matsutake]|nr:hypothetical protein L208DRAFT_490659 [Tricholoma matsutake 945]